MKIVSTSDWRDTIAFETPVIVAEMAPGEPTRCSVCGSDSEPRDRSELWALKHRHPKQHGGFVRFYCEEHLPAVSVAAPAADSVPRPRTASGRPAPRTPGSSERRLPSQRKPPVVEHERAVCPDCWVEVSATGECGMCGRQTA